MVNRILYRGGLLSESEAEFDEPESQVKLTQDIKTKGAINLKSSTSAIRLSEIGPRLKLKLVKIEEGICDGEVLYHEYLKKTPEEIQKIRESLKTKK
jgi:ribosome biogenesis protein SSF1/2